MKELPAKSQGWKLRLFDNPDEAWREFGRTDPYYGVLSAEEFRAENLDAQKLEAFFGSGEEHIAEMLRLTALHVNPDIVMGEALDFGCGVGRLVLPLASRFRAVAGVDISSDYIAEAQRNCARAGYDNATFAQDIAVFAAAGRHFDFIHSCIVFNHIPWARGRDIIRHMFQLLNPGGVLAIGVLHKREISPARRLLRRARVFLPVHWLLNLAKRRPVFEPLMQSNEYPLDELLPLLNRLGARSFYIRPHLNQRKESWAVIFCMRDAAVRA